jgi:hypothetical protein
VFLSLSGGGSGADTSAPLLSSYVRRSVYAVDGGSQQ